MSGQSARATPAKKSPAKKASAPKPNRAGDVLAELQALREENASLREDIKTVAWLHHELSQTLSKMFAQQISQAISPILQQQLQNELATAMQQGGLAGALQGLNGAGIPG